MILIFGLIANAQSYTSKDHAIVKLTLDKDFPPMQTIEKNDITTTIQSIHLKERVEQITLNKPADANIDALIKGLHSEINTLLAAHPGYEAAEPISLPQPKSPFKAWLVITNSPDHNLSSFSIWIDADKSTLYLITYRIQTVFSTQQERYAAIEKLKAMIQVCYKTKCYGVQ